MNINLVEKSKWLELPKLIIQKEQRVICTGQDTNTAFYILAGKVINEDTFCVSTKYYQPGELVCIQDFLGSNTYLKNHKATAGTTLLCLTIQMFKEIFLSNDRFAWALSKLLASESLFRGALK